MGEKSPYRILAPLMLYNPPFWVDTSPQVASPSAVYRGFPATGLSLQEPTTIQSRNNISRFAHEHARLSTDENSIEVVLLIAAKSAPFAQ